MRQRAIGVLLAALLAVLLVSCTGGRTTAPTRPAAAPESLEHAVARLLGSGAVVSTADTRTIPGRSPVSFLEVRTETTPTAASILGVLSAMAVHDAGQGRHMSLRVTMPTGSDAEPLVVGLRWNPTDAAVPAEGARAAMPPGSMWLTLGRGRDVIVSSPDDTTMLASHATTGAIARSASGEGALLRRLRDESGLR